VAGQAAADKRSVKEREHVLGQFEAARVEQASDQWVGAMNAP
jgi:hypothetical protein